MSRNPEDHKIGRILLLHHIKDNCPDILQKYSPRFERAIFILTYEDSTSIFGESTLGCGFSFKELKEVYGRQILDYYKEPIRNGPKKAKGPN